MERAINEDLNFFKIINTEETTRQRYVTLTQVEDVINGFQTIKVFGVKLTQIQVHDNSD